jgi:predicted alpha/beta superfamily hydrolase
MKLTYIFLYFTLFPSLIFSQRIDSLKIDSKIFDTERKVLIYTPWEYENDSFLKCEVIYVFDAQAREYFDNVHSALPFLNNSQFPMIVVGVVSEERNKDFLPENEHPEMQKDYADNSGGADRFIDFLNDELIPYVESQYRTLPKRIAVGHSNGATFIMYCLFKNPEIFDACIAISPNLSYNKEQLLKIIAESDPGQIKPNTFVYMCNANEDDEWTAARKKTIALLKKKPLKDKIVFINQNFSATDNHLSIYPKGVYNGLKNYLDYQFFDANNLIAYYSKLYENKKIDLSPYMLKQVSYAFLYAGKTEEALKILVWAVQLFSDDLDLYNSIAEMYQHQHNQSEAIKYYRLFKEKLEQHKDLYTKEQLDMLRQNIDTRIKDLENTE